uniref:Histone deacetylase domain-containing protein n=1 Tax=Amphiprion ocellaris TaxID=80972 RepID=A0A3Q1CID6_AMPOC
MFLCKIKHNLFPACKIEVPERLTVSHEALVRTGLTDRCVSIPVREATDADILLVHSEEYLEAVKKTPYMTLEDLKEFTLQYGDVYFHPNIYHCAKLAAGAALQLVDSVMTGKVRNGMALVRPPGHHSMRSAANGFCVFNNVAIAARYAKQKYGLKRVLIVDWDIHHGQGVQFCFEDDPSVLCFSWHRYEHQKFWPQLRESEYDNVGKEKGAGFNINVPWNKVGMENSDYLSVFCHVLLPVAYEFCPDLVLVCAGFDSAIGDPEGEMCATPDIFAHLTHLLMNLAGGRLCAVLEGGYNLTSLPQSVCQTVQTLLGDPLPQPANLSAPCTSALESLHCVRSAHRPYWSCLKHAGRTSTELLLRFSCHRFQSYHICGLMTDRYTRIKTTNFLQDADDDSDALTALSSLISLTEKMNKNEVIGCLHLVCLSAGCSDMSGFLQAVFGLLLPLGYEYDPDLVLLVRISGVVCFCGQHFSPWLLFQEDEKACVGPTASCLLGDPAPPLERLQAALPEDVEAMERLRHKLQAAWKLLQTTGERATAASHFSIYIIGHTESLKSPALD